MTSEEIKIVLCIVVLGCLLVLALYNKGIQYRVQGMELGAAQRYIADHGYTSEVVEEDGRDYSFQESPCYRLYVRQGKVYECKYF